MTYYCVTKCVVLFDCLFPSSVMCSAPEPGDGAGGDADEPGKDVEHEMSEGCIGNVVE